jgi:hypothetical protein
MDKNSEYYKKEVRGKDFNKYIRSKTKPFQVLIKFFPQNDCLGKLQYKTGLNVNPNRFNPTGEGPFEGMYFTNLANFYNFYRYYTNYGEMVAIVTIPSDARVYCEAWSAKTDQISISERMTFPQFFETIPKEMWMEIMKIDGRMWKCVPLKIRTNKLFETGLKQNGEILGLLQEELRTPELCEIAVQNNGLAISNVPLHLRKKELCESGVKQNGRALRYVPEELITPEMCEIAVQNNGFALEDVPKLLKTEKICAIAVRQCREALSFVPEELRTVQFYEEIAI